MSNVLNEADVEQVLRLVESLERSGFDYLEVQVGDLRVTIGKGDPPALPAAAPAAPPAPAPQAAPAAVVHAVSVPAAPAPGLLEITAPTMGIFYAQPEPGKPPFVTVGAVVEESTTVALVEVMKTFHAVSAGLRGTIVEVCVADAGLVEFGQVLYRVRPDGDGAG